MAGVSAARNAAYRTLCMARERDAYVRELLNSEAGKAALANLKEEDRGFARRLALGVCATKGTLDEALDKFIAKPSKVSPGVRDALRVAAYEILFLKKSPHVAVSQGVELVRAHAKGAAGLANAVLRRVSENADEFLAASPEHAFGLPSWLYDCIAQESGEAAASDFGQACLAPAPVYIATVPMWISDKRAGEALSQAGIRATECVGVKGAWLAGDPASVPSNSLVGETQVIVSDLGAQIVAMLAAPEPGDRVLEVGSGRGTKTILLVGHAHRAQGAARIWALDLHGFKTKLAAERLEKARVVGVKQVRGDATELDAIKDLPANFDHILVDAPCSGTGTLRRHPEITWSLTPEAVESCAELQLRLLNSVAPRVAPGGMLTYATCSVLRRENERVVAEFLAGEHGADFELVPPADVVPADDQAAIDTLSELTTPEGFMRTKVSPDSCDGHFCACLRRRRD